MDVLCPSCTEPWDNDTLHDEAEARAEAGMPRATYAEVAADFRRLGCRALTGLDVGASWCEPQNSLKSEGLSVIAELMGDDMDGYASLVEDFEWAGMFDE